MQREQPEAEFAFMLLILLNSINIPARMDCLACRQYITSERDIILCKIRLCPTISTTKNPPHPNNRKIAPLKAFLMCMLWLVFICA